MLKEFEQYIQQNELCAKTDEILLAVSGGADSVALLHLFHKAGYSIALAHCNFNLRGKESDGDEDFVRALAAKYSIESHFISFDTDKHAKENKQSIEMAARELRYNWFNDLCKEHTYTKIATGHHLNDSIETFFINLTRGTGIIGITGIKPVNDELIRPMLFSTRTQIEEYIKSENIDFRTDSSNESDKYVRNIVRNQIIPAFKKINPSFESTMASNLEHFTQAASIFNEQVNITKHEILLEEGGQIKISISKLLSQAQPETILHEIISEFGFSDDTLKKILQALEGDSGRTFYSATHQLLVDREFVLIEKQKEEGRIYQISNIEGFSNLPIKVVVKEYIRTEFELQKDDSIASLDANKLVFPLILRLWSIGDSFYPLGMSSKKKLSDFFIDQKIDRFQKDKTWILESEGKIVWVVGLRIDNRYKVRKYTEQILQITLQ